jgi:hypothetical protein
MNSKSQIIRIVSRMGQMIALLAVFAGVGFLLPIYAAPTIFSALSITPYEESNRQVSVRITNRNIANDEEVVFGVSSPGVSADITAINYSCKISDVTLLYPVSDGYKRLPCGTDVYIPARQRHSITVQTSRPDVGYLPVTLRVDVDGNSDEISTVIATALRSVDQKSDISDNNEVTLNRFGGNQ